MAWKKSSAGRVERFKASIPKDATLEPKSMFGYPAFFVRGNFFSGLFEELVVMRMPELQKSRLDGLAGAKGFSPMSGKAMTDWYVIPEKIASSPTALAKFLEEALVVAKELPVKKKKPKKKAYTVLSVSRAFAWRSMKL